MAKESYSQHVSQEVQNKKKGGREADEPFQAKCLVVQFFRTDFQLPPPDNKSFIINHQKLQLWVHEALEGTSRCTSQEHDTED